MHRWRALLQTLVVSSAFVVLTGAQSNGCDPGDPGPICEPVVDPECPDGQLEPGGVDGDGCALPAVCVPDPCVLAGGTPSTYCTEDDACPDRDCGCQDWCDCGPTAYFDGQTCVPFPDPCTSTGGAWDEWCQDDQTCLSYCVCPDGATYDEMQGCLTPPDPNELCEWTGGTPNEWCQDACWEDQDGDGQIDDCGADPVCWTDCDCGWDAYFDPWVGCVTMDPGVLCEQTGGHFCDGWCECPWGTYYDEWSGCIPDPWVLCDSSGGVMETVCSEDDGQWGDAACWDQCTCPEGYVFDTQYGCYPGQQLLCEWSGGSWDQTCSDDWGQESCWDECTCPEGTYFDGYSGCVVDYATLCVQAGGEWVVTCDEQWGSCWEDCACPDGQYFDWVSACVTPEDCENGVDDDGNGLVDCDDWACSYGEACFVPGAEDCGNGLDDDGDGTIDCEDVDCDRQCQVR